MSAFRRSARVPLVLFAALLAVSFFLVQRRAPSASKRPAPPRSELSSKNEQKLQKFDLTGYDEKGKKFWNLEGNTAKIEPGQTVFLDDQVTLRLKDNTVIRTEKVRWSQDPGVMTTDAAVAVDHPNAKITGVGAIGRPAENFIQLNRRIVMDLAAGGRITCDGPMKLFYHENKMIFFRKVRAEDERGVLTAKRMDVFFDAETKKLDRIEAVGEVVIQRGTDTTHSRRAIYVPATGSIRLEGNPQITLHEGSALLNGAAAN